MRCSLGSALHQQYLFAEEEKLILHTRKTSYSDTAYPSDQELLSAWQEYIEAFATWLAHEAFCHHCKPAGPSARTGEASVFHAA